MMKFCAPIILWIALAPTAHAQSTRNDSTDGEHAASNDAPGLAQYESAHEAVHEGNLLLTGDDPDAAITAYEHARRLEPHAREVDFVEGLALYAKGDYERARTAFENAATSTNRGLVDDAIYSVGTTYHAEALQSQQDPKHAIDRLEQAMRRYQTVLAGRPDHEAARDANLKAAAKWRTLKQLMQEQQQQQDGESGETNEDEEQQESNDKQQQENEEQSEQQQQSSEQQDEQQEQSKDQQPSEQPQQDKQSQSQQEQEQSQEDQQQQQQENQDEQKAQQQQQQEESKADAERKLREMMQALRDRNKKKPREAQTIKVVPVDKDW